MTPCRITPNKRQYGSTIDHPRRDHLHRRRAGVPSGRPAPGKAITLKGCALRCRVTTALAGATPGDAICLLDNAVATPLISLGTITTATDAPGAVAVRPHLLRLRSRLPARGGEQRAQGLDARHHHHRRHRGGRAFVWGDESLASHLPLLLVASAASAQVTHHLHAPRPSGRRRPLRAGLLRHRLDHASHHQRRRLRPHVDHHQELRGDRRQQRLHLPRLGYLHHRDRLPARPREGFWIDWSNDGVISCIAVGGAVNVCNIDERDSKLCGLALRAPASWIGLISGGRRRWWRWWSGDRSHLRRLRERRRARQQLLRRRRCAARSTWAIDARTDNAAPTCTQPNFTDLAGTASAAQEPLATLLAGRAGTGNDTTLSTSADGTLYGSTTTAKSLILRANSADLTTGEVFVNSLLNADARYLSSVRSRRYAGQIVRHLLRRHRDVLGRDALERAYASRHLHDEQRQLDDGRVLGGGARRSRLDRCPNLRIELLQRESEGASFDGDLVAPLPPIPCRARPSTPTP